MRTPLAYALILALPLLAENPAPAAPKPVSPVDIQSKPSDGPAKDPVQPTPKGKPRVKLNTSYGPVVLELEPELAPETVANFLRYIQNGHYKDTIFHRVIPGFMIQGGGHLKDLTEKPNGAPIRNEVQSTFKAGLKNSLGTVAMARLEDPHSATAQFYINTADNASLDPSAGNFGYCAFGRVVEGMENVLKIEKVRTVLQKGMQNVPEYPVRIKDAKIVENVKP